MLLKLLRYRSWIVTSRSKSRSQVRVRCSFRCVPSVARRARIAGTARGNARMRAAVGRNSRRRGCGLCCWDLGLRINDRNIEMFHTMREVDGALLISKLRTSLGEERHPPVSWRPGSVPEDPLSH
jgi:hypothetical protein